MPGNDERKLGLLRRCDLLVHVVRCFDLYAPKPYAPKRATEDAGDGDQDVLGASLQVGGAQDGQKVDEIDWPLSATPIEDVKSVRADMALADLHFIEERQK